MNRLSTTKKLVSIPLLFLACSTVAIAQPPVELFPEPPQAVHPGKYGIKAHVANIDLEGPSRGLRLLSLQLPDGRTVELERSSFEDRGLGKGLWKGHVTGYDDSQVVLTINKRHLVGRIVIDGELFEVRPYRGQKHIVERLDPNAFPECDNALHSESQADVISGQAAEEEATASEGGTVTIDLLSVYTPNARDNAGGTAAIETLIQAAVDNANISFINSNMNARYRLVHVAEINQPPQATTSDALHLVHGDSTVAALRDQYGADMVSFIVDTPSSCGTGYVQRNPGASFASAAFQATDIDCAVGNLTFVHEHGHNMGMEHNPENSSTTSDPDSDPSYPWSYAHYVNGSYRTIMSYSSPCSGGCPRVTHFSNPNVDYAGLPTGVADEKDNARTGNLTSAIIENFRDAVAPQEGVANVRIVQSLDDVEENMANGNMYFHSTDLEFGYDDYVSSEQVLGLRFINVSIPQGATITNAYLQFTADEIGTAATTAVIHAESSDSADAFTTTNYNLSNRTTITPVVNWSIPEWNSVGELQRSPNITSLLQELVNRSGWNSGGNMVFVIHSTGGRTAEAYDGGAGSAPLLHVEYDTGTTVPNEVPTASFTSSVNDLTVNFSDNSTDSDGNILSWSWDFDDGSSSTSQNPSHTYAAPGLYTVTLTVTDNDGATDSTSSQVTVSAPALQPLAAPSNLTATVEQSGKGKNKVITGIALSWTDNADNETGFVVEGCKEIRSGKGKNKTVTCVYGEVGTLGANVTSFTLDPETENDHFRVKTVNDNESSDWSNEVKI